MEQVAYLDAWKFIHWPGPGCAAYCCGKIDYADVDPVTGQNQTMANMQFAISIKRDSAVW